MRLASAAILALVVSVCARGQGYTIDTFAGGGAAGLHGPQSVAADAAGNVYFTTQDNMVMRADALNAAPVQVAGNGNAGFGGDGGPAAKAQLRNPAGVAVDAGGSLYIADTDNNRVRKVSGGVITTVAGGGNLLGDNGQAAKAQLHSPTGVAVDAAGNLFIADSGDNRVRKVNAKGIITTVAGNGTEGFGGDGGPATQAKLCNPYQVAVDAVGSLFVADFCNARIRKVTNGTITTIAGTGTAGFSGDRGPAGEAQLTTPEGVAVDAGGRVYIADTGNDRIRVLTQAAGAK